MKVFISSTYEDFPWKKRFIEHEKEKELGDFLEEVKREKICTFFTSVPDFEIKLSTSIGKFMVIELESRLDVTLFSMMKPKISESTYLFSSIPLVLLQ